MRRVLAITVAFLVISAPAFSYDFILVHAGINSPNLLQAAMLAEEDVDTFDLWNTVSSGTPVLGDIEDYDGVMISSDYAFPDPTGFGNTLADYVDDGGVLIITTFAYGGIGGCGIQGDIAQDPYSPLAVQDGDYGSGMWNLDIADPDIPDHPTLDGVSAVGCNWHNNNRPLNGCGNSIVKWTGGANGLAYNDNENVVGFTGHPGMYGSWMTGDGALMFRNAFVWMIEGGAPGSFNLLTPADGEVIDVFTGRGGDTGFVAETMTTKNAGTITFYNRTEDPVDVEVTFTWEESMNAEEYEILVDDDYTMVSPLVDETGLTDETYTHTFSVDHTITYYWRVIASNENGDTLCNEDFDFEFNYNNTSVAPASLGEVKATFR